MGPGTATLSCRKTVTSVPLASEVTFEYHKILYMCTTCVYLFYRIAGNFQRMQFSLLSRKGPVFKVFNFVI